MKIDYTFIIQIFLAVVLMVGAGCSKTHTQLDFLNESAEHLLLDKQLESTAGLVSLHQIINYKNLTIARQAVAYEKDIQTTYTLRRLYRSYLEHVIETESESEVQKTIAAARVEVRRILEDPEPRRTQFDEMREQINPEAVRKMREHIDEIKKKNK